MASTTWSTTLYTLTTAVSGSGSIALDPPGGSYASGTTVQLTAEASVGWHFDHWEGDLSGSTNPTTILMDGDKSVTAVFVEDTYTLTTSVTGSGSIVLDPPGGSYTYGTTVQLTAEASVGWHFDHWEGDLSGSTNPTTILMDGDKSVTAVFLSSALYGDLNCDGSVDFGDINPFVLYLSNFSAWQITYAGCNPENGDINGDGLYPDFGDINPFVALLTGG
jgi:hypothetical protein